MWGACAWTVRVSVLLFLLRPDPLDSQQTTDHRKVPKRVEFPKEFRAEHGEIQGSWGTWGSWSTCSHSCGNGVQMQTRPCLPVQSPRHPSRVSSILPERSGQVISVHLPTVDLHRDAVRSSNSSGRGETWRDRGTRPGGRRRFPNIIPGRYGYGRAPFVAPLQTDAGPVSEMRHARRQRRSAASTSHHSSAGGHGSHRVNSLSPSNSHHRYTRPYVQPRNDQVWVPLYQPSSVNQADIQLETKSASQTSATQQYQERPYDPLPSSYCHGEHAHYKICNSNACPPSSRPIRAVQCSSYNNQPFMGRLYEWEPFNEVPGEQHCELHCRAIGFRFYVRQSEWVIDGAPCGLNDSSLCVAGKCMVGHKHTCCFIH